jgi:hypothetical protein
VYSDQNCLSRCGTCIERLNRRWFTGWLVGSCPSGDMLAETSMNVYTAVLECGNDRWTEAGWRSGPVVMISVFPDS